MRKICFFVLIMLISISIYAQVDTVSLGVELDLEDEVERLVESNGEDCDYSELVEDLMYYAQHKININNPDYDVLLNVFQLSDYQVYHLQRYLQKYGQIYTIYELALIEGFDRQLAEKLAPYIAIIPVETKKKRTVKDIFKYGKNTILLRYGQVIEKQKGYSDISEADLEKNPNARYLGSPQAYMIKYKFRSSDKLQFGITMEKDAGEPFFRKGNKYGFDFYSAHIFLQNISVFKAIAVGDYQLSFGQGLAMNTGFAMMKPQNSVSIYKHASGLRPYSSANENNYMRGVATTINCKVLDLTLFYSYKKIDAAVSADTNEDATISFIETLYETGYHRTQSEMSKKNSIGQHLAGMNIAKTFRIAEIGATVYYTRFQSSLNRTLQMYKQFTFNGIDNVNASIDYRLLVRKVSFFGEVAMSKNLALATIDGMQFNIDPRFTMSLVYRYYSPKYQCLNSGAFGEMSSNANEHGLYWGFNAILSRHFTWNAHVDYFHFAWLKYQVDAPSDGFEVQTQLDFKWNSRFGAYVRFRYKSADKNNHLFSEYYNQITAYNKQNYRLHLTWQPLLGLQLKTHLEIINYRSAPQMPFTQGYVVYQDVKYKFAKFPLTIAARFALFDTDSYDTRIYAYEDDILYTFSIPGMYYKGSRMYLLLKYNVTRFATIEFKIAQTYYRNKAEVGSGLTLIDGNHKTDVKAQVQFKF